MVQISRISSSSRRRNLSSTCSLFQIFQTVSLIVVSFYVGTLYSDIFDDGHCASNSSTSQEEQTFHNQGNIDEIVQRRVESELAKLHTNEQNKHDSVTNNDNTWNKHGDQLLYFPKETSSFLNGIARIEKDAFVKKFDYGLPIEEPNQKIGEVLLLYNSAHALPTREEDQHVVQYNAGSGFGILDVDTATENCDTMNVINTNNPGHTRQCLAIVGNYESYHIQRWMRVPENSSGGRSGGKLDKEQPLRAVSRGHDSNGSQQFVPPDKKTIMKHWEMLRTYLDGFEETLANLKAVAEKVAVKNTIIVMTCNMGQSELLMNFVCNAKAKGLDVSNVLVFPTDQETKDLAEGLGLTTFYDEKNFGKLPKGEAKHYGDRAFVAMMFAKVVCVQMINYLGYDVLFQDVDVVWYKNPLDFFHDPENELHGFDMYFQDDGAHSVRYSPYSANSGFYYIRSNAETKYFLVSLLYAGDMIITSKSHQQALIQVLAEHASQFGTRVKILSRDMNEFPGGWHYNSKAKKDFMKSIAKGDIVPYIFHMSW
eukprot:CAMPEP_0176488264 /NCGR_PEP_ID=MMETSP0200_2-20121128/6610_1 /TAXON_ID=947934 /ORGANISM="Chaetoceros sp., Strain GSL56" /LENGTH=537 /DNA_ID=CAMNT_0017885223 /DNA_START=206 /DNA_END=1816 /DNA_ORIENTATION=-